MLQRCACERLHSSGPTGYGQLSLTCACHQVQKPLSRPIHVYVIMQVLLHALPRPSRSNVECE